MSIKNLFTFVFPSDDWTNYFPKICIPNGSFIHPQPFFIIGFVYIDNVPEFSWSCYSAGLKEWTDDSIGFFQREVDIINLAMKLVPCTQCKCCPEQQDTLRDYKYKHLAMHPLKQCKLVWSTNNILYSVTSSIVKKINHWQTIQLCLCLYFFWNMGISMKTLFLKH